jgi:HD-GYP domain-containing protein (c-di-GMP phosphodiesterase class II)
MRVTYHYLFSIIALIFYGGQVCPFIDTLSISRWGATLVLMFAIAYLARRPLMGVFVLNFPLNRQVRRQFALDMSLFFSSGLIISIYNHLFFDFPLGSGAKITLGCLTLGFFAAADMVLERERDNHEMIAVSGGGIEFTDSTLSLTSRFVLISSFTVLFMAAVIFLVVSRDLLVWIESIGPEGLLSARLTVVKELAFVGGIFLLEVINLVFSFSKNLKLFFNNENETLIGVAEGDFNRRATVSTGDEFGIMASYTNEMIKNLKESTENLQKTQDVTILTLASLAETRDNETGAHILRTQRYVKALAEEIRLDDRYTVELNEEYVNLLFKSAPLHDIGKVGVPDSVLLKPGKLSDEEFMEMKKHPKLGRDSLRHAEEMLGESSFLNLAQEIAFTHHEKWDGSGYPRGLKGEDIPLSGRLMALADVYDALISKRMYKKAFSHQEAKDIIVKDSGSHFDPKIVESFLEIEGSFVEIAKEFKDGAI